MKCPRRDESFSAVSAYPEDDSWREDSTCSYCGSASPERLFKAIEDGEQLGPTDKNYKVYIGSREKFYFQHLDEEQMKRFVELHNAKALKVDYPGHFYVLPFFMRRGRSDDKTPVPK